MHSYESVALRVGRGCGERAQLWRPMCPFGLIFYSFSGGLRFIISMAEGRSFGAAAEGRKGQRKQCIFPKSDALLVIGLLTREKKGEKRCESSASLGMHHFHAKIGGSGGVAGACFRADFGCKVGEETRLFVVGGLSKVYRFCLCFVKVFRVEQEGNARRLVAYRCI